MAVGYKQLDVLLYRNQTALGTPVASLTVADSTAIMDGFAVDYVPEFEPLDLATGTFGQQTMVRGAASVDIKVDMPITPNGTTTALTVSPFLLAAGMSETISTNQRTYAPSSDTTGVWKDMTLWAYSGERTAGACIRTTAHSAMFDFELTAELGKPALMSFTGKAACSGAPDASSFPAGNVTIPSSIVPATLKATTMTVGGKAVKLLSFGLSMGNTLALIKDMSSNYGYAGATITKRESKWKARAYAQSAGTLSPYPLMDSTSAPLSNFAVTWGPTSGSRITVAAGTNKCQITKVTQADEDGIGVWDMEGIFVDNDFSIAINVT